MDAVLGLVQVFSCTREKPYEMILVNENIQYTLFEYFGKSKLQQDWESELLRLLKETIFFIQ